MSEIKVSESKVRSHMRHPSRSTQNPKVYETRLSVEEQAWIPGHPTGDTLVGPAVLRYEQGSDGTIILSASHGL